MTEWLNVGKIVNTHGIRGEVRVISITDFPEERYEPGNQLYLFLPNQKEPLELKVKTYRRHKNFDLLSFDGYENINVVEPWKNGVLKFPKSLVSDLEEGEFYFHEIIGCKVITDSGTELGVVKEILTPGANDVWVVKNGQKEYLIPYIDDVIVDIHIDEKKIIINALEGLLE